MNEYTHNSVGLDCCGYGFLYNAKWSISGAFDTLITLESHANFKFSKVFVLHQGKVSEIISSDRSVMKRLFTL